MPKSLDFFWRYVELVFTVSSVEDESNDVVTVTRSGRRVKQPKRYEPKEVCEDDYDAEDYDSGDDDNMEHDDGSIVYDSEEGGSSMDEYDSDFINDDETESDGDYSTEEEEEEEDLTEEDDDDMDSDELNSEEEK